jgi:hypothetical protein
MGFNPSPTLRRETCLEMIVNYVGSQDLQITIKRIG